MKLRLFFQAISNIGHNVKSFQLPFKYTFTVGISTLILLENASYSIIHRYRFDRHNQILGLYSIGTDILYCRSSYLSRYQRQILGTIPSLLDCIIYKVIPHLTSTNAYFYPFIGFTYHLHSFNTRMQNSTLIIGHKQQITSPSYM